MPAAYVKPYISIGIRVLRPFEYSVHKTLVRRSNSDLSPSLAHRRYGSFRKFINFRIAAKKVAADANPGADQRIGLQEWLEISVSWSRLCFGRECSKRSLRQRIMPIWGVKFDDAVLNRAVQPLQATSAAVQLLLQSQQPVVGGRARRSLAIHRRLQEVDDAIGRQHTLFEVGQDDFVQGCGRDMASLADRFALFAGNPYRNSRNTSGPDDWSFQIGSFRNHRRHRPRRWSVAKDHSPPGAAWSLDCCGRVSPVPDRDRLARLARARGYGSLSTCRISCRATTRPRT